MVSVNVAQLLQEPPGAVRDFDFSDPVAAVAHDVPLRGPITGHARLTRTNEGILVHAEHTAPVTLECSRCLNEVQGRVRGAIDEEFLPSVDLRTGVPIDVQREEDQPRIDEHHEIDLDEVLRQNILTCLPLQPLCEPACPGLCPRCGERLDGSHAAHPESDADEAPIDPASPFARLASLLDDVEERER
jgi:DUF177 domain-containing protein